MKRLGLCFLIYDKINHEELWYQWLKKVDKQKYRVYIHYKNNVDLKYFEKYKLNNCIETKYSDITLVKAQNILIETSINDGCSHQILLSNSCIPLKWFDYIYDTLDSKYSYFNKANDEQCFPRCSNSLKYLNKTSIKKAHQWCILNEKHAKILLNEIDYMVWFDYERTVPDEHCYITKLFQSELEDEIIITHDLSYGATTFTNWGLSGLKNYDVITMDEIENLLKKPCLFGRKFNTDCKVIKNDKLNMKVEYQDISQYLICHFLSLYNV